MTAETKNGSMIVSLQGHIDSGNAEETERTIRKEIEGNQLPLILDMDGLEYISSAGLRIVLRLHHEHPELKVINVCSSVYEIFEMTGFSQMMPVEKAYRRLSVDGCEIIGRGANGNVYRLDPDTIIKVYKNPDALPEIRRETDLARKALVLGVPTAIPFDVVKVNEGYGSVFELLNAKSLAKLIAMNPDQLEQYARVYIDLLKIIHSTHVKPGDMPDEKQVAVGWTDFLDDYLPIDQAAKLHALIEAVEDRDTMIHGDYHVKNIMLQNGEALLIDMDTLSMGHPIFELASMFLAYKGYAELDHSIDESFLGITYDTACQFWDLSLKLYLGTDDPAVLNGVEEKCSVIGYARMMRRSIRRHALETEDGRKLVDVCRAHLSELLSKYDTLEFVHENAVNRI